MTDLAAGGVAAAGLEAHLEACGDCRRELRALREGLALADAVLGGLAVAEPSAEFRARLVESTATPAGVSRWRWAWLPVAAAAVLAVLFFGWLGTPGSSRAVELATPVPAERAPSRETPVVRAPESRAVATAPPAGAADTPPRSSSERRAAVAPASPEVIVAAGQERLLVEYVALVRAQRTSPQMLLAVDESVSDPHEKEIQIAPLEIAPLDPAEGQGM